MNKKCLMVAALVLLMLSSFAQNIGINADASRPNPNAILDIKSANKGLLIPRMDSLARKRIPDTRGLMVYDISTDNFWYNTGKEWKCIPTDKDRDKTGEAWLLKGNGNTTDGVDFLGTTNNVPLNIRVNNQPSGRIDSAKGSTFFGYKAGLSNTAVNVTAIGLGALQLNTTGYSNTAVGWNAMFSNTTGSSNTAFGQGALNHNVTGVNNTATGTEAIFQNIGSNNTATGFAPMFNNVAGSCNTATGAFALTGVYYVLNNGASYNTADGYNALVQNAGDANTATGVNALSTNIYGSNNCAIGAYSDVSSSNLTNATAIGSGATVDASNKVRIGNSAVTVIEGQVPFTTPSDGRYKFNVREDVKGLDFILHLRPVTYQFDVKRFDANLNHTTRNNATPANYALQAGYDEATHIRRTGFIAQEVEQAANASDYDFSGIIRPKTEQDHYSLSYDAFVVPLVKAIQEQQQIILQQDKKLASLQQQLDEIKKSLQHAN